MTARKDKTKPPRRFWTAEDDHVLRARFPHETTAAIARDLGRTERACASRAQSWGLKKSAEHLASAAGRLTGKGTQGGATRFKPGHQSWNKGKHYAPGGRCVETQFKPGTRPQTWVPIGTEVRDPDGYLKRKVRDDAEPGMSRRNWVFVHRALWEEHHGPIPRGHAVVFRDGDNANITLDNLELVTSAQLMLRNTVHNLPPELAQVVMLRGAVVRQVNKRRKQQRG